MNKILIILSWSLIAWCCTKKKEITQSREHLTQATLQAVLISNQFDSLVNGLFEFRGQQLTIIRNELIKTDIPLKMNGKPVKFTNTNLKLTGQLNPYKPIFHAELVHFKLLAKGEADLTITIYSVGLICDVKVKELSNEKWAVSYFKWYRT